MKEFFSTTKGKSLFKLWLWVVFILVVYIVLTLMPNAPKEEEDSAITHPNKTVTSIDLSNKDYSYNYKITINEENILLNGEVINNVDSGYKETKDGIIKYEKIDGTYYQVNMDEREEIPDFYNNLEPNFIDYALFYPIINNLNCSENICQNTYNEYEVTIDKSLTNSFKVTMQKLNEIYKLTYTYK